MTQTLDEYLHQNQGNVVEKYYLINHVMPITDWLQMVLHAQGQASWANLNETQPIADKPRGCITIKSFFNPDWIGGYFDGQPEEYVDNLDNFILNYGKWEVTDVKRDNTYNWTAPIEDYIDYTRITVANPDVREFDSKDILLFRCGLGLDPRDDYTDYGIAIFDNQTGDHYNEEAYWSRNFNVANGDLLVFDPKTKKTQNYCVSIDTSATSESYTLALFCQDDTPMDKQIVDTSEPIDCYNFDPEEKEDITDAVMDQCDLTPANKLQVENLQYCCELNE